MLYSTLGHEANKVAGIEFMTKDAQYCIFFADIQYADTLQLFWPIIDTDTDICVYFFPHT